MDFSRKAAGSKSQRGNASTNQGRSSGYKNQNSTNQEGSSGYKNQKGSLPSYSAVLSRHEKREESSKKGNLPSYSAVLSRHKQTEESSKTRILRPAGTILPKSKEYSKGISSSIRPKFLNKQESAEEKKNRLKVKLNRFDSPFNWRPRQVKPLNEPETIIKRMQEKDEEIRDERKFRWRHFIFHLVITYESWRANKISQALEEIDGLESLLKIRSNRTDFMFTCIEDALWHVVNASKAFLYLEQDELSLAEDIIEKIQPWGAMNRQNKAGIHGIKAAMFMEYGHRGNKNALWEANEAVKLDQTCAEWHFYVGKCLGRIRRVAYCHELVNPLEVKAMNAAIKQDKGNARYKVFLGQVLAERAFREYKNQRPDRNTEQYLRIRKTNKAAWHCFKEAIKIGHDSPHILIRSARGLMRLPPELKELKLTKECIDKAVELAPNNPMVHHVQAMYHERYDCDAELQFNAYEKAASLHNFGAAMDLVRLHHKLKSGDIIEELELLASKYEQRDKLQVIYAQAGSYLLFIKKDLIGALKYYLKVMEMDPEHDTPVPVVETATGCKLAGKEAPLGSELSTWLSAHPGWVAYATPYALMSHKPMFFRMRYPVNMIDVLLEELDTKTDWKSFSMEDQKVLRKFRFKAGVYEPANQAIEKKKRLTVEEILELSRKTVESDDMYKEAKIRGQRSRRERYLNRRKQTPGKKWRGKNKETKRDTKPKKSSSNEKILETSKNERQKSSTVVKTKRRDSFGSVSSVDSNYQRDSTKFGPRGFFIKGSNESLCTTKKSDSHASLQDYSLELPKRSNISDMWYENSSRDPSTSSMSSAGSSVDFVFNQTHKTMYPPGTSVENQLSVENLKKFDSKNSNAPSVRRSSTLSLSSMSSSSSLATLSVMDRVKQSYAMLGRNNEPQPGKKKHFKKYSSTQSLDTKEAVVWKKDHGSFHKRVSSQSLDVREENLDDRLSKSYHSRFLSRDSSVESSRSFSFLPDFARKNSQSDTENK